MSHLRDQIVTTSGPDKRTGQSAPTSLGKIARGSTINLIGAASMGLSTFLVTVAVTRGLSQASAGIFFSATSLFLLATAVGQLGTAAGLVYFISRARALGKQALISTYVRVAVRPVMTCAVLMAIAMIVFAPQLAAWSNPNHAEATAQYLRVLAVFIPIAGLENVALSATRGMGTMRANALVEQLGRPLLQLVLVGIAVFFAETTLLGWAWGASYAPAALLAWIWWKGLRPVTGMPVTAAREGRAREFWAFSGPRALTSVIQVVMQRFDIVLVGAISGPVDAAIYAAATRFTVAGQMGNNAIALATQPAIVQSIARNDDEETNRIYRTSTAWLMLITWPIYFTFIVFGSGLVQIFGRDYESGANVLLVISVAMLISTGCGMVDMVLTMAGRTTWNLANAILALGVMLALDLWLIPLYGPIGAAIGWGAAIVVRNVAALTQVGLSLHLHPLGRATITAGALGSASFGLLPWAVMSVLDSKWDVVIAVGVSAVCFGGGLLAFRRILDLGALRSVLTRRRRATPR